VVALPAGRDNVVPVVRPTLGFRTDVINGSSLAETDIRALVGAPVPIPRTDVPRGEGDAPRLGALGLLDIFVKPHDRGDFDGHRRTVNKLAGTLHLLRLPDHHVPNSILYVVDFVGAVVRVEAKSPT